jgi:hypothetical protein
MEVFTVVLKPGQRVAIQFHESDGQIDVEFGRTGIKVKTDWPDQKGRKGIIYNETFNNPSKEASLEVIRR